jgi:hypothetical protein
MAQSLAEDDTRHRPVLFETRAEPSAKHMRRPLRLLIGTTVALTALAGAAGLAFGGSAVWAVIGPQAPNSNPAPLWIAPPSPVTPVRTDDDTTRHRLGSPTTVPPTSTDSQAEHAPGNGAATGHPEPGDGRNKGGAGSGSGSGGASSSGGASGGASGGGASGGGGTKGSSVSGGGSSGGGNESGHG